MLSSEYPESMITEYQHSWFFFYLTICRKEVCKEIIIKIFSIDLGEIKTIKFEIEYKFAFLEY